MSEKYTNEDLAAKVEWEGTDYLLEDISPHDVNDLDIREVLWRAQNAYDELKLVLRDKGVIE